MKDYEIEKAERKANEEASAILAYLQNIDDVDKAVQFARAWLKAVNVGLRAQGEEEIDDLLFRRAIAETDRRFWDRDEMGDEF